MSGPAARRAPARGRGAAARRRRARLTLALLALFSLAGLGWLVARSSLLDLEKVRVEGAEHTSVDDVRTAAAVRIGEPLLFVDKGAVAARVERLPWVADADVSWSLPATLVVAVEERVPVAWIRRGPEPGAGLAIVDADGRVLDHRSQPPAGIPELALDAAVPAPGGALRSQRDALRIAATVPASLRGRVLAVDPTTTGWVLRMDVAQIVRLGSLRDADDLAEKWSALEAVVEHLGPDPVYLIDVRAPSVPSVRREEHVPEPEPEPQPETGPAPPTTVTSVAPGEAGG